MSGVMNVVFSGVENNENDNVNGSVDDVELAGRVNADVVGKVLSGVFVPREVQYFGGNNFLTVWGDNYRWLPDETVDFVLTDPPFNIAQDTNFHTWENNTINSYRFDEDKGWDSYSQEDFIGLLKEWSHEFARVLRPGGNFAVFCADKYLSHFNDALEEAGLKVKRTLTWRKPNAVPINRKYLMMSACEYVLIGSKGNKATFNADLPVEQYGQYVDIEQVLVADKVSTLVEKNVRDAVANVYAKGNDRPDAIADAVKNAITDTIETAQQKVHEMYVPDDDGTYLRGCVPNEVRFPSKGGATRLHPTEKPVPLLKYLVSLLSNPGDLVLDPFGGSGSTGKACLFLDRPVVIVEQDKEYYDKLTARLKTLVLPQETLL